MVDSRAMVQKLNERQVQLTKECESAIALSDSLEKTNSYLNATVTSGMKKYNIAATSNKGLSGKAMKLEIQIGCLNEEISALKSTLASQTE